MTPLEVLAEYIKRVMDEVPQERKNKILEELLSENPFAPAPKDAKRYTAREEINDNTSKT